jgi:hypothetical protein
MIVPPGQVPPPSDRAQTCAVGSKARAARDHLRAPLATAAAILPKGGSFAPFKCPDSAYYSLLKKEPRRSGAR